MPFHGISLKQNCMINLNLKTAARNLRRNKVQSLISILGLGIGLGSIILLMALVLHEKSFDKFIPDYKNVYRIILGESCNTQFPLSATMKEEFPEVKNFFRFYQVNEVQFRIMDNVIFKDQYFGFSDPQIFEILGIKMIVGKPANSPTEVAISEKMALKYFRDKSPLGSVLSVKLNNNFVDLNICGIYKTFPATSTLMPEFIADIKLSELRFRQFETSIGDFGNENRSALNWTSGRFLNYLVLESNADPEAISSKMEKYKELINDDRINELAFYLQPVSEIYLKSTGAAISEFCRRGDPNEFKYYEIISLIILLISVTNYIFLTRASISDRIHELGTRKVLGATQNILRKQIILEANLITALSLIPAAFIINSGMTFINENLNKTLNFEVFSNPLMWLLLFSAVMLTGVLSGVLIGYNISRIPVLLLLSGKTSGYKRSRRWNYSFLVLHFGIYIILVVSVITVSKQIRYSLTNFKGINPENILVSELNSDELKQSFTTICDEMEKIPGVIKTAGSSFIPPFNSYLPIALANTEGEKVRFDGLIMGEGMTELLGIEVIDGESFGHFNTERRVILFNESSALKYNVKAGENYLGFNVIGILKDFHAHSLHTLIQPMVVLQQNPSRMSYLAIKTDGTNDKTVINQLRALYIQIAPDEIFEIGYLTDQINDFYSREKYQGKIIGAFSLLAMVLSVMGLFGIALISISKRKKEIGLRKVNGASIWEILYLLNIDFVKWVVISAIISIPVSIYIISSWLDRFAYKTELSFWIFASAGLSAIIIAIFTVSWQSWKAATLNPVEALRYE